MRRFQIPNAALIAGLAILLSGCSGETPTAPAPSSGPGAGSTGPCSTVISLSASTVNPITTSTVRATVTKAGVPVPDGSSVQFTTDLGFFGEIGLQTISKTIIDGVADVTVFSSSPGTAHVIAVFDCAKAQLNLQFSGTPAVGPFISSVFPTTGSCAGGDTVTILGGRFNGTIDVLFGGVSGSIVSATATQIVVKSPARALKNPAVPETVPLVVSANGVQTAPASFTYVGIDPLQKVFISSISPTAGTPAGGDTVQINGGHFGVNTAATQVTFCGRPAQITAQQDQQMTVTTPAWQLADPALSKACDVVVTRDIGLCSQQSATSPQQFTYRGSGGNAACNTDPTFFISSIAPNSGGPDGGTAVVITGGGFGSTASLLRVDFGGVPATIVGVSNISISVSTPRHTLASPDMPETVDVTVTDLGSPVQRCARVVSGFVYTAAPLQPVIFSVSPRTGPNDASTRVSIFGTGFQFPMQVFLTGGSPGCGAQLVEAAVSDISLNTIVFKTPVAVGGNVCLSNQLVTIVILNPSTGKTASCTACFKYYSCPTIQSISPASGPYTGGTQVVITGNNFEEPVIVSGAGTVWSTVSVSSQQIIAVTPPANLAGNACTDIITPAISVNSTSLSCPPALGPPVFTYLVKTLSPSITSIQPSSVPEAGNVSVSITGSNFFANSMRVIVNTNPVQTVFPASTTPTQITFSAPPFRGTFLTNACTVGGVAGVQNLPTPVNVDVLNAVTTCASAVDQNQITYIPADQTCKIPPLAITTTTLPNGTTGTTYNSTLGATGGAPPYTWALVSGALPTGLNLSAGGVISGIPTAAGTFTFTVSVTDSLGVTKTAALTITVVSPPLLIATTTLPNGTLTPPLTPYSFTFVATGGTPGYTWAITSGALPPGLNLNGVTGLISGTPTTAGTFTFAIRVTDSVGGTATAVVSITITP
jgi:hypothetical protein